MQEKIYNNLPSEVKTILILTNGWLVGSSITAILSDTKPNDYDIILPNAKSLTIALQLLRQYEMSLNSWAGFKFKVNDITIDIWEEDLGHFIQTASKFKFAYSIVGQKLIAAG